MRVLGVDPGLNGGLAVVARDGDSAPIRLLEVIDTPTEGEGPSREVSPLVLTFIQKWRPDCAYIERAQAMPSTRSDGTFRHQGGSTSAFVYGGAYFAVRLAIRGCLVPLSRIESRAWKTALELPPRTADEYRQAKEDARQKALQLFPDTPGYFDRVMDHNRAEAALIACYGMMLAGGRPAMVVPVPRRRRRRRAPLLEATVTAPSVRALEAEIAAGRGNEAMPRTTRVDWSTEPVRRDGGVITPNPGP
jgi:hypothetical protein